MYVMTCNLRSMASLFLSVLRTAALLEHRFERLQHITDGLADVRGVA